MVLDSYLMFEPDVVEVCDCRCHYGLVESNTDRMILMTLLSCVDLHSIADNEIDAMETVDVEVNHLNVCCYIVTSRPQMPVLSVKLKLF